MWERIRQSLLIKRTTNLCQTDLASDCQKIQDLCRRVIKLDTDQNIYGVEEYWATPDETLAKGAGDCEDHAILKWSALCDMGYPQDYMSIWVGLNSAGNGHALLVVSWGDTHIVLDSMYDQISIDDGFDTHGFKPYYGYGQNTNWKVT